MHLFNQFGFDVPKSTAEAIRRGDLAVLAEWAPRSWGAVVQWAAEQADQTHLKDPQPVVAATHRWIAEAAAATLLLKIDVTHPEQPCFWDASGRLVIPSDPTQCAELLSAFVKLMAEAEKNAHAAVAWAAVHQRIVARTPETKAKIHLINRLNRMYRAIQSEDLALWSDTWTTMPSRWSLPTTKDEDVWNVIVARLREKNGDSLAPWLAGMAVRCPPLLWWDMVGQMSSLPELTTALAATPTSSLSVRAPHEYLPTGACLRSFGRCSPNQVPFSADSKPETSEDFVAWLKDHPAIFRAILPAGLPMGRIQKTYHDQHYGYRFSYRKEQMIDHGSWLGVLPCGALNVLFDDWTTPLAEMAKSSTTRAAVATAMLSGHQSSAAWKKWNDVGLIEAAFHRMDTSSVSEERMNRLDQTWAAWASADPLPWFDRLPQSMRTRLPVTAAARAARAAALPLRRSSPL